MTESRENAASDATTPRLPSALVAVWDFVLHVVALAVLGVVALVATAAVAIGVGAAAMIGARRPVRERRRGWTSVPARA
ncbi:MAG: hypothetical protein AAFV51_06315 [Pseudomonadota bacterium]